MFEALFIALVILGACALALVGILVLPLLLVGILLRALAAVILLPFKALGGLAAFSLAVGQLVLGLVAACGMLLLLLLGGVLLLPLVPLLLLIGTAWIGVRLARGLGAAAH